MRHLSSTFVSARQRYSEKEHEHEAAPFMTEIGIAEAKRDYAARRRAQLAVLSA